ncbi:hypothetical protein CGCF415_v012183 [Colletotrichum fructicola]|nr:hypothetical protein CGCF415_v012183 [Colletotrichum fructicola]KAF4933724.1 hypothetical protein CGCF245_v009339 [Colletotrichum fructicola]KAF5496072.1 hypothetical protein CGCF413_v009003 [Colletotrichum fructicola]KAI8289649.1 hypothetical protein K4K60_008327 [Colletotrichum sp. SAR11_57]
MSAQQNKAPSAGTKVQPGASAPTTSEPTGPVPAGSLAAESAANNGSFAANPSASSTSTGSAPGSGAASVPGQAGAAPTYVNNQYTRDPNGPHGKNITEGFDDKNTKDGVQAAMKAEIGSENDPGRVAEQHLKLSQTKGARDAGPRQGGVGGETVYEKLKSDVQA